MVFLESLLKKIVKLTQLYFQGREGQDYPQLSEVPQTSFSCQAQKYGGYYADPETDCQAFHICHNGLHMGSFLCPNGTLFHQALFVCDWWYNVDCGGATLSYGLNRNIGQQGRSEEELMGRSEEELVGRSEGEE